MPSTEMIVLYLVAYIALGAGVYGLYLGLTEELDYSYSIGDMFNLLTTVLFWPILVVAVVFYVLAKVAILTISFLWRFLT